MVDLTEEYIQSLAYNVSSFSNAKKIVNKNQISNTYIVKEGDLIYGECSGSGKSNYKVSVDFINPQTPVFRCTCPSRQIPCKHSIALLYQYYLKKDLFIIGDLPEDVASKREKIEKKEQKKKDEQAKPKKVNVSAFIKKMKSQLEGIKLVDKFIDECFTTGFASIPISQIKTYKKNLVKEMANYYLPEHAARINEILDDLEKQKNCSKDCSKCYNDATNKLAALYYLNIKSSNLLNKYIEEKKFIDIDGAYLFTKMGYVWKIDELKNIGLYKENGELLQLGFYSYSDDIRQNFVDIGFFINLGESDIYKSINIRPFKISDKLKADDTIFEICDVSEFYIYPGDMNPRIRWEGYTQRKITVNDLEKVISAAKDDFKIALKSVKEQLKNTLADKNPLKLLKYKELIQLDNNLAIMDKNNEIILLDNCESLSIPKTTQNIELMISKDNLKDGVILGMFEHDFINNRLIMQPISIVTKTNIIRLLG